MPADATGPLRVSFACLNPDVLLPEPFNVDVLPQSSFLLGGTEVVRIFTGDVATFSLRPSDVPTTSVSVSLSVDFGAISPSVLVFDTNNWQSPQTFSVQAPTVPHTMTIHFAHDSPQFFAIEPLTELVSLPIVVSGLPHSLYTNQKSEVITLTANGVPSSPVSITAYVLSGQATLSSSVFVFDPTVPESLSQTFLIDVGSTLADVTLEFRADPQGAAEDITVLPSQVSILIVQGGSVLITNVPSVLEVGQTASMQVSSLLALPQDKSITIALSSSVAILPTSSLTFTAANWQIAQTVPIVAPDAQGNITVSFAVVGSNTVGFIVPSDLFIHVVLPISISAVPEVLYTNEMSSVITLTANGAPVTPVSVQVVAIGGVASTMTLTFGGEQLIQTFTVLAGASAGPLTLSFTFVDAEKDQYDVVLPGSVSIALLPQSTFSISSSSSTLLITGASTTFSVQPLVAPTSSVTLHLSTIGSIGIVTPSQLVFTSSNWATSQSFTVAADSVQRNITLGPFSLTGPSAEEFYVPENVPVQVKLPVLLASIPSFLYYSASANITLFANGLPSASTPTDISVDRHCRNFEHVSVLLSF